MMCDLAGSLAGAGFVFRGLAAPSSGKAPDRETRLQDQAEHQHHEREGDRIIEPVVLGDGLDKFHAEPPIKKGNTVAAYLFPGIWCFSQACPALSTPRS
jgi:hypothetical protein